MRLPAITQFDQRERFGYTKICAACDLARTAGWSYAWVDTNCTNKSSSTELSKAIKLVFQVSAAPDTGQGGCSFITRMVPITEVCFAYLENVNGTPSPPPGRSWSSCAGRPGGSPEDGPPLQELIAPLNMVFYDCKWASLVLRDNLAEVISAITGIDCTVLVRWDPEALPWERFDVVQRMAWLAPRSTTRVEDLA